MDDWLIIFERRLENIEAKLDALVQALADENIEAEGPTEDLDGNPDPVNGGNRDIDYAVL
jgi:hypothetical protein